jgi:hypothetical protein
MKTFLAVVLALASASCAASAKVKDCAEICRALDMRLAYIEVAPYSPGQEVQSCTCSAPEEAAP